MPKKGHQSDLNGSDDFILGKCSNVLFALTRKHIDMKKSEVVEQVTRIRNSDDSIMELYRGKLTKSLNDVIPEMNDVDKNVLLDEVIKEFAEMIAQIHHLDENQEPSLEQKIKQNLKIVKSKRNEQIYRKYAAARRRLKRNNVDIDTCEPPDKFKEAISIVTTAENLVIYRDYEAAIKFLRRHEVDFSTTSKELAA